MAFSELVAVLWFASLCRVSVMNVACAECCNPIVVSFWEAFELSATSSFLFRSSIAVECRDLWRDGVYLPRSSDSRQ